MGEETEPSLHERLVALEATCAKQEAQIAGLIGALSDLLAAHVVLHKDLRLCSFLQEYMKGDSAKEREGGTVRIPPSFFGARTDLWAEILQRTAGSPVFDQFWFRSLFWHREERQRAQLDELRKAVERKLEF